MNWKIVMKLDNDKGNWEAIGPLLFSGTQLAVTCLAGVFLGVWLDQKFDLKPFLTIFFAFLFAGFAFVNFIRVVKKVSKK